MLLSTTVLFFHVLMNLSFLLPEGMCEFIAYLSTQLDELPLSS